MKRNRQSGFSAIEALLTLVIVGLLGFVGWYVWHSKNQTDKSLNEASNSSQSSAPKPAVDQTANWEKVTSGKSSFIVKIPDGWNVQNWASRDYLYAAAYKDLTYSAGKRATVTNGDTFTVDSGPVRHFNITGNPISEKGIVGYYFRETPQDFGPVSGVTGKKYVHTYDADADGIKKNDKVYQYRFEGTKSLITVDYYVLSGEKEQVSLVEKAIKTLILE